MGRQGLRLGQVGRPWATETATGKIQARVRVRDQDGVTREVTATGPTETDAFANLQDRLKKRTARDGRKFEATEATIADVAAEWLESRRGQVRASTVGQYRSTLDQVLLPEIGRLKMTEVNRQVLRAALLRIARGQRNGVDSLGRPRKGRPITGEQPRIVLTMIMAFAWDEDYLDHHPMAARTRERRKTRADIDSDVAEETEIKILTGSECLLLGELLHASEQKKNGARGSGPELREICALILGTGLRIGEVCALRWGDLTLEGTTPTLNVTGTFVEPRGEDVPKARRGRPKSRTGTRALIIDEAVVDLLEERFARLTRHRGREDYVFSSRNGSMLWPNNLRSKLRTVLEGTGLKGATPHTLRRTFATSLERARGIERARDALGHIDSSTTSGSYVQPIIRPVDVRGILPALSPAEDDAWGDHQGDGEF